MKLRQLTDIEQAFAEKHHDLIYAFLNEKGLDEDEYYDVVIFGYLRAVEEYCENPSYYKCSFSTLAWLEMKGALSNHLKKLTCAKRNTQTISFNDAVGGEDGLQIEYVMPCDECIIKLKTELLLHELARRLPEREMRIVKMKVRGDKLQDIARAERLNFQQIGRLLDDIYPTVIKIIYE